MQKTKATHRRKRPTVDIVNAEKKLRQAAFFLKHLELAPRDIAEYLMRAVPDQSEILEFYFSACLSSAQSVFFTLRESGGDRFRTVLGVWRKSLAGDDARERFNDMTDMRGQDVHFGVSGAESLPAMIPADPSTYQVFHNAALFGPPGVASHTNPDGIDVTAPALIGTRRLYVVLSGERVDATTACRVFIEQLRSLKAAVMTALEK